MKTDNQSYLRKASLSAFLIVLILAAISTFDTRFSLLPNTQRPSVLIEFKHDYNLKELINTKVIQLESSLQRINGVRKVEGTYTSDKVRINVYFNWSHTVRYALDAVSKVTSSFRGQLPSYYEPINVKYIDPGIELYASVASNKYNNEELIQHLTLNIKPQIDSIEGISHSFILDSEKKDILISLEPIAMLQHQVTVKQVIDIIGAQRFDISLGRVIDDTNVTTAFRVNRSFSNIDELSSLIIGNYKGNLIRLKDIARIFYEKKDDGRLLIVNEKQAITVAAWPYPDSNVYQVSKKFEELLASSLKGSATFQINNSPKSFIYDAIIEMFHAVTLGIIFSLIIVLILFRKFGLSVVNSLAMPMCLVLSIGSFRLFNIDINILSIAAISVSIGMVIDNSALVINQVLKNSDNSIFGIFQSVRTIIPDLILTTLTTVVVFLPIAATAPTVQALFSDFCIVICLMVFYSFLISVLVIPFLLSFCSFENAKQNYNFGFNSIAKINSTFKVTGITLTLILLTFSIFALLWLIPNTNKDILPKPLPTIVDIGVYFKTDKLAREQRIKIIGDMTNQVNLKHTNKVRYIIQDIRSNLAYISIFLKSHKDAEIIMRELRSSHKDTDLYSIDVFPWVSASLKDIAQADLQLNVSLDGHSESIELLKTIQQQVSKIEGIARIKQYPNVNPQKLVTYQIDHSKLADIAQTHYDNVRNNVYKTLEYTLNGKVITNIYDKFRSTDVKLNIQHQSAGLPIFINDLNFLTLSDVVRADYSQEYDQRVRVNGGDRYFLEIWIDRLYTSKDVKASIMKKVNSIIKDARHVSFQNNSELDENINSLIYAIALSLLILFVVLYIAFNSGLAAFVSILPIPIIVMSSIFSLYIFDSVLTINAIIGILILIGVFINNHIVVFRSYMSLNHLPRHLAIANACTSRLKVILISTLSTIAGAIPLILDTGTSTPIMRPLGIVLVSGFTTALVIMYLITPSLLILLPRKTVMPKADMK